MSQVKAVTPLIPRPTQRELVMASLRIIPEPPKEAA